MTWARTVEYPSKRLFGRQRDFNQHGVIHPHENNLYFHHDGLGSVAGMSDSSGSPVMRYRQDAYGNPLSGILEPYNAQLLTEKRFDTQSGLYYFGSRWYDPGSGRFMNQDSYRGAISEPMSQHRYTYVHNNPINMIDTWGYSAQYLPQPGNNTLNRVIEGAVGGAMVLGGATLVGGGIVGNWVVPGIGASTIGPGAGMIGSGLTVIGGAIKDDEWMRTGGAVQAGHAASAVVNATQGKPAPSVEHTLELALAEFRDGQSDSVFSLQLKQFLDVNLNNHLNSMYASADLDPGAAPKADQFIDDFYQRNDEYLIYLVRRIESAQTKQEQAMLWAQFIAAYNVLPTNDFESALTVAGMGGMAKLMPKAGGKFDEAWQWIQSHYPETLKLQARTGALFPQLALQKKYFPSTTKADQWWLDKLVLPSAPHKNKTDGHWEAMLDIAESAAKRDDVVNVYLNKGLGNELPGIYPNRRPDVFVVRKDGKIDQYEVPSKTDAPDDLLDRMNDNKKNLGDRAGNTEIVWPKKK